jgi:methylmalonyl-CoA mutase C-terminal domain/subunit
MNERRPIRVLIAKPGLDGHDVGAKVIVNRLRNAGMEVIYTGLRQSTDKIISAAILSGSHVELCQELMERFRGKGIRDILVIVGGIIPREDIPVLKNCGVDGVFPVHSTLEGVENFIREQVSKKRGEGLREKGPEI